MGSDLVIPQQLAREMIEVQDRIGVKIVPGSARPIRIAGNPCKRRRIANAPIGIARRSVDCGGIPDTAAAVDLWIPPEVIRHRLELPAWLTCIGIDCKDHPARATLITAKLYLTLPADPC